MKKTVLWVLLGISLCSTGFADDNSARNARVDNAAQSVKNFFKKLNPMPFLREQERRYNERKAGGGGEVEGVTTKGNQGQLK